LKMSCRVCGESLDVSLFLFPHDVPSHLAAWEYYVKPGYNATKSARLCHVRLKIIVVIY
jgi:hypothetical protein